MNELKIFRDRLLSLKLLIEQSDLSDEWKTVARDAVLGWAADMTETEWMQDAGVTSAEAEHLRNAGCWPWRKES